MWLERQERPLIEFRDDGNAPERRRPHSVRSAQQLRSRPVVRAMVQPRNKEEFVFDGQDMTSVMS